MPAGILGMIDYQMMVTMLQGSSTTDSTPMVRAVERPGAHPKGARPRRSRYRLPDDQQPRRGRKIRRLVPLCAARLSQLGPIRAALYGGPDYHAKANDVIVAFGMIETQEALDNLDAILSTSGLDAIYIGPSDLSISLGYAPGGDKPDEWMMAALKKVLDGCKRHKVQPGIHCGAPSYAKKMIEMGFTFVTVGGDNRFMTMGGQAALQEMRSGAAAPAPKSSSPY